jgi:hypothetical protein
MKTALSLLRLFALLPGLLLLDSPAGVVSNAKAAAPALPEGVKPVPVELGQRIQDLTKAAEQARGLTARQAVPSGMIEPGDLRAKMEQSLREDLPPKEFAAYEGSLKAFGLIPESMDLARALPDLLASQVVGFYDPHRKYLAVVRQPEGGTSPAAPSAGPGQAAGPERAAELAGTFENLVLVHELVHALQDQSFDLAKYTDRGPLSDEGAARLAVVEGDATLTMFNYLLGGHAEAIPGFKKGIADMMGNPDSLREMSAGFPGGEALTDAPAWLRETLMFSYLQGALFAMDVREVGGQVLLDRAFAQDPPRSTEQILHPEKWHGKKDEPAEIRWPDLSSALPGFQKVGEGHLGELGVRILLSRKGGKAAPAAASKAAAGWGGDRFVLYEKAGRRVLVWITEWDTEGDAREARSAFEGLGQDWRVIAPVPAPEPVSARRIGLFRGSLTKEEKAALEAVLASPSGPVPAR